MIGILINLLIVLIILGLAWWVITQLPLPAPIGQIVRVVFVVICALVAIFFLLGLVGYVPVYPLR